MSHGLYPDAWRDRLQRIAVMYPSCRSGGRKISKSKDTIRELDVYERWPI